MQHSRTNTYTDACRHTRMWIRVSRVDSTSSCRHLLFFSEEGMLRDVLWIHRCSRKQRGGTALLLGKGVLCGASRIHGCPVSKEEAQPFFSERECFAVLQGSMDALFFKEEAQQQLGDKIKGGRITVYDQSNAAATITMSARIYGAAQFENGIYNYIRELYIYC